VSDLREIKERIYNEERIGDVLEALGCQNIRELPKRWEAQLPPEFYSSYKRSVQVNKNPSLTANVYTRGINGDIFAIIGYILFDARTFESVKDYLFEIKKWICNTLGYREMFETSLAVLVNGKKEERKKKNWTPWLDYIRQKRKREVLFTENDVLNDSIMDSFLQCTWQPWIDEGISRKTQIEFEVALDHTTKRAVFAVRDRYGKLIGVKGRYFGDNPEIMKEQKYRYIYSCNKSVELYNLHRALPYIFEQQEVIIVEGAKSVWLLWQFGYKNAVSIEGDKITDAQIHILKELGVGIRFIFAWDKDKEFEKIEDDNIVTLVKSDRFYQDQLQNHFAGRLVYLVRDEEDLLTGKESPIDRGKKVWDYLYNNKLKYFWKGEDAV